MHHPCFDIGVCLKQEVYKTAKQALQIFIQINRRVQLQGYYIASQLYWQERLLAQTPRI